MPAMVWECAPARLAPHYMLWLPCRLTQSGVFTHTRSITILQNLVEKTVDETGMVLPSGSPHDSSPESETGSGHGQISESRFFRLV